MCLIAVRVVNILNVPTLVNIHKSLIGIYAKEEILLKIFTESMNVKNGKSGNKISSK